MECPLVITEGDSPLPFQKWPSGTKKAFLTRFIALELGLIHPTDYSFILCKIGCLYGPVDPGMSNWHLLRLTLHYLLEHMYMNNLHALT